MLTLIDALRVMKVLVVNCGSSSLKYQLFGASEDGERLAAKGTIEKIGEAGARAANHREAAEIAFRELHDSGALASADEIDGIGHRVVHGGERFTSSVLIDDEVERGIEACADLAPLHNPHNLTGYRAMRQLAPRAPHVAVFDTAFHATLAPHAFVYGLPYEYYERDRIRRYGFHGTSHRYIAQRMQALEPNVTRVISCHLGNGCSVCAIEEGRSVDISLGFTPLEGVLMGTRSGDIDASAVLYVMKTRGMDVARAERLLNHESGLLGVSGVSNDMRDLQKAAAVGNARAALAIDIFCYRVRKYIGAYMAAMNGAGAVVFTAGIGENSAEIRAKICTGMENLGIHLDVELNRRARGECRLSVPGTPVGVWMIPTNEELLIARDTRRCILAA